MFVVYALESLEIGRIYIGHTGNLDRRLQYHNSGYVKSTARDRPWALVAYQKVSSKSAAMWIERALKGSRGRRSKWIEEHSVNT